MKTTLTLLTAFLLASLTALHAAPPDLTKITSRADLDACIAATSDAVLKQSLSENATAILAAAEQHPHVEAVIRTIESAPGTFKKVNCTPEALRKTAGGDIAIFDTLTMVNTGILNGHPHANRDKKTDPYDAAFIGHLGQIPSLENVSVVVTALDESSLDPILKLNRLKALRIEKRGGSGLGDSALAKLAGLVTFPDLRSLALHYFDVTDAGLEHLAGLKNLESFSLRAHVPGHAFAKFEGWENLRSISFHGNGIDDEGLGHICERFPNLETLNLIHARVLTDDSGVHLSKLQKLERILINGPKITAAWLANAKHLPIESLNIAQGAVTPASEAIATIRSISTLRRLSIDGSRFTDADLAALAAATQLTDLAIGGLELPDDRISRLQAFGFLKTLALSAPQGHPPETEARLKAVLPNVQVKL
jgi:hypothetical protein